MRILQIHLEGDDPAIAEHRMSLEQLASFSKLLIAAYRRTAQELITGNRDGRGRMPDRAKELQLELEAFSPGCINLAIAPRDTGMEHSLMLGMPLEEAAISTLGMSIVEARSAKAKVNPAVRKMLRYFPKGIRQRYSLVRDGHVAASVEFTSDEIPVIKDEHPRTQIEHRLGKIRGVLLKPPVVFFEEDEDKAPRRLTASDALVQHAWALRESKDVVATVISSRNDDRLIGLRPTAEFNEWQNADHSKPLPDLAVKWASALTALAEYDRN